MIKMNSTLEKLAYYEVLDTIKNDLIIAEYDLQECGLDIDLDNDYLQIVKIQLGEQLITR